MRRVFTLCAALILPATLAFAQNNTTGVVKLRGTRLTYPLVRKWIEAFNKEYPGINVSITPQAPADSIDFTIASYAVGAKELEGNRDVVAVARYVQLLIVNDKRPGLEALQAQGITERSLRDLFFEPVTPSLLSASNAETPLLLYVRDRPVCAVKAFAGHFGDDPKKIQGTPIKGDDEELAASVRGDINGTAFNNLGFIYDVQTRKVSEGLAIIPLDLNENGAVDPDEQVYRTLDDVIAYVEKTNHPKFVNERVNVLYKKDSRNAAAGIFLNWVLTEGQSFNHELGFLKLNDQFVLTQQAIAAETFRAGESSSAGGVEHTGKAKSDRVKQ